MKGRVVWAAVLGMAALMFVGCQQVTKVKPALKKIHFDFDKYNIKPEWVPTMKANAEWLQKNPNVKIVIEGHCDERGTSEYNIGLGDRRAKSAKAYLVNLGVDGNRISTISYGEERPVCTAHNESCWWQNRRAEFVAK